MSSSSAEANSLKESLAELAAVTGGLAHEIRNPLSTLKVNLQLLREDWHDLPPADAAVTDLARRSAMRLDTMLREVDRLAAILDDFLRFAGRTELQRRRFDLNGLIDELADFIEPQARSQGVRLVRRGAPGGAAAVIDPDVMRLALLNLALNALQAMPSGGDLSLQTHAADGTVRVTVADTGCGIPAERLERIFEAYYSTREGGTGLGLATARRIVREHGGRIEVQSEPGRGSTFTVVLPDPRL